MKESSIKIGKFFVGGYLCGKVAEKFSGRKTAYSMAFATVSAVTGTVVTVMKPVCSSIGKATKFVCKKVTQK